MFTRSVAVARGHGARVVPAWCASLHGSSSSLAPGDMPLSIKQRQQRVVPTSTQAPRAARIPLAVGIEGARPFTRSARAADSEAITVGQTAYARDEMTNASPTILSKVGRNLLHVPNHPLKMIKDRIADYFTHRYPGAPTSEETGGFSVFDSQDPAVTVEQNFDSVLVPEDHVSRSRSDNYYLNQTHLLRAHTSAHQRDTIMEGNDAFLLAGDVYRRDEIDRSHYPIFHQMEGVRLFSINEMNKLTNSSVFSSADRTPSRQELHSQASADMIGSDLKQVLEGLVFELFGTVECRWVETYFPFTHPSWELEILFEGEWLEVLGCGVMEQEILENADADDKLGWAFGLGLERLAMVLYNIQDIRLFWSEDQRFISQFDETKSPKEQQFLPFSKYPPCLKDITFWVPEEGLDLNTFSELVRGLAGDLVEEVTLIDEFVHPKTDRTSNCYRIVYRSMDRVFTNEEVNVIQEDLRAKVVEEFGVELR